MHAEDNIPTELVHLCLKIAKDSKKKKIYRKGRLYLLEHFILQDKDKQNCKISPFSLKKEL